MTLFPFPPGPEVGEGRASKANTTSTVLLRRTSLKAPTHEFDCRRLLPLRNRFSATTSSLPRLPSEICKPKGYTLVLRAALHEKRLLYITVAARENTRNDKSISCMRLQTSMWPLGEMSLFKCKAPKRCGALVGMIDELPTTASANVLYDGRIERHLVQAFAGKITIDVDVVGPLQVPEAHLVHEIGDDVQGIDDCLGAAAARRHF